MFKYIIVCNSKQCLSAVGCADPNLGAGMTMRRQGKFAFLKCNSSEDALRLRCIGTNWVTPEDSLAAPYSERTKFNAEWTLRVLNCSGSTMGIESEAGRDGWIDVGPTVPSDVFPYSECADNNNNNI